MTLKELFQEGKRILTEAGIGEAELDAWYLLQHVFKIEKSYYYVYGDREPDAVQESSYREMLQKRAKHVPLQYLTNEQEFMGLSFYVNRHVLIPRQDTEILVEEVLGDVTADKRILDMCTGSGCIAVSIAAFGQAVLVAASDISEKALEIAKKNAEMNGVQIEFFKSDLFDRIEGKFDIIVSNPPYIRTNEIEELMPEVRDFEPRGALDGMEDGLCFYRRIANDAKSYLTACGALYFEIGCEQAEDVSSILIGQGYQKLRVVKDYAGLDRVVVGYLGAESSTEIRLL